MRRPIGNRRPQPQPHDITPHPTAMHQTPPQVDLSLVLWRCREPAFFGAATSVLRARGAFDVALWCDAVRWCPEFERQLGSMPEVVVWCQAGLTFVCN